jgi:hypothetical protein
MLGVGMEEVQPQQQFGDQPIQIEIGELPKDYIGQ